MTCVRGGVLEFAVPWYRCLIRGENFPGAILKQKAPIGFYTTRDVEADSAQEAEAKAMTDLKADKTLHVPEAQRRPDAQVFFEEITELERPPVKKPAGFSFFT